VRAQWPTSSQCIYFTGDYPTWESIGRETDGYADPAILERVRTSSAQVRDGLAAQERDGVAFSQTSYSLPLLACLLRVACDAGRVLRVIDFGGALGTSFFQCRSFFPPSCELRWNIVEQPHFVECGRREFETGQLRFFQNIDSCVAHGPADVVLLSSVLPYLKDPYRELGILLAKRLRYVLLDRTPLLSSDKDRLTLQHIPASMYGKAVRYPAWLLSGRRLRGELALDYELLTEFDALDPPVHMAGGEVANYVGQLWKLRA
jgi:putative methyltransferase (TIGR04325 family)